MANRLADATSPYLLQHADNPVDWWEWGDEAFAEAERRDVPIFLSIGYSACHWCHVMAHESFEDEATAALLNEHFVSIKVDREERPDVDAVHMQVTQALTGHGGWPMSVWLTPDRLPFHAGTYFPPEPRQGMPSFRQVLGAVVEAWTERRDQVEAGAGQIVAGLQRTQDLSGQIDVEAVRTAVTRVLAEEDRTSGGFGGAPKFPQPMVLDALLATGDEAAIAAAGRQLTAMARGGIFDQLAGGFARYSVDRDWVVPHFEKMLYDNALLLGTATRWFAATADPLAERVVRLTVEWLRTDMLLPSGAFAAALDADAVSQDQPGSPAVEGAHAVWTPAQLAEELGDADGAWVAEVCSVTPGGTFEAGTSTLQLADVDLDRFEPLRKRLLAARRRRPQPARDDKVVLSWNAWLVSALVEAAGVFAERSWLTLADTCLQALWQVHRTAHGWMRTSRDGVSGAARAVLDDLAALGLAAADLGAATGNGEWLRRAVGLAEEIRAGHGDETGGFHDSPADGEQLWLRPGDPTDNATPSGTSTAIALFRRLALLGLGAGWDEQADRALAHSARLLTEAPRFAGWLLRDGVVGARASARQVVLAGAAIDDPLTTTAFRAAPAGSVLVLGPPDAPGVDLLADRPLLGDRPTAYVCAHFTCRLPVTEVEALTAELAAPALGVTL